MAYQILDPDGRMKIAGLRNLRLAFAIPKHEILQGKFRCYVCGITQNAAGKHLETKRHLELSAEVERAIEESTATYLAEQSELQVLRRRVAQYESDVRGLISHYESLTSRTAQRKAAH